MNGRPATDDTEPLSVQLDLYLEREPIRGRLRTEHAEESFVGWLGFIEALRRLSDAQTYERS